ncbi:MAG: acyltransferase [Parabacteroides sp.]|nr:acyltransferase [Parabacteroides sp.]
MEQLSKGNERIKELDYLKCVFILLMIIFHLVYIGDKYPYAKQIVYTFHMSAFLVISGYLANIRKKAMPFFRALLWIFIPYVFMEIGYVIMSSILPVREKVAEVSASLLLHKVFIAPMGPYWYLHTLILCSSVYYIIYNFLLKLDNISRFILVAICLFVMSYYLQMISFSNVIYFMMGIAIYQSKIHFISVFQPSILAVIPFIILCCFPENLDRGTLAGVTITYLAINISLFSHRYLPEKVKSISYFIGRNTLIILIFSPIFTILAKLFIPFFSFDPSGLCFMCTAVIFTVTGCFAIGWFTDKTDLSRFCFGKTYNAIASNKKSRDNPGLSY